MKIAKCNIFSERFEYVGWGILQVGNPMVKLKYDLVKNYKHPEMDDDLLRCVPF